MLKTKNQHVLDWVSKMALMCKPDEIQWLDGSEQEEKELIKEALRVGDLIELNQKKCPAAICIDPHIMTSRG